MSYSRSKTSLHVRIPSALHDQLQKRAKLEGTNLTALCTDIFEREAQNYLHNASFETFYPQIEKIIDVKVMAMSNRLAKIFISTALDVGTLRNFMSRIARLVFKLTSVQVNEMMNSSYNSTLAVLRNRAEDQTEILAAIDDAETDLKEIYRRAMANALAKKDSRQDV